MRFYFLVFFMFSVNCVGNELEQGKEQSQILYDSAEVTMGVPIEFNAAGSEHMMRVFGEHTEHQRVRGVGKAKMLLQRA